MTFLAGSYLSSWLSSNSCSNCWDYTSVSNHPHPNNDEELFEEEEEDEAEDLISEFGDAEIVE